MAELIEPSEQSGRSETILGVQYDALPLVAREYADNLREQIAQMFRLYNVTSYSEFRDLDAPQY